MTITVLIAQETVVDPASGEIIVEQTQVVELDDLYETSLRIQGACRAAGAPVPNRLFQRVTSLDRAAYVEQTQLEAGWRYADRQGEPVCIITALAVEDQVGGFDVKLHGRNEIYTTTARQRRDWATVEEMADWICLETGADYCLLTVRYTHGGELTGLGWWPPKIDKTGCRSSCRCP